MQENIFILSQPIQTGKTTLLMKWLQSQQNVGGILTPDVDGVRKLYDISGQSYHTLQSENETDGIQIGKFVFAREGFEKARNILKQNIHQHFDWIVADEIGRLELNRKEGLEPAIGEVIKHFKKNDTGDTKLLLVIRDYLLHEAIANYGIHEAKVLPKDFFEPAGTPTGIVLCGGKSSRMGRDKAFIRYHDKEQYLHVHDLLKNFCNDVFISCNSEQANLVSSVKTITDNSSYTDAGPMTGVLSTFQKFPGEPLLVVGCDYPYLDREHLAALVDERSEEYDAVCYVNPDGFEEPLIAIYETSCAPLLLAYYQSGQTSLRQFLKTVRTKKLSPQNPTVIVSVDTPGEQA